MDHQWQHRINVSANQQALLVAGGVAPPYTFVNSVHGFNSASATTLALPALSLTTGNHIFVHVMDETGATTSVTDTAGNVYTRLTRLTYASGPVVSQWFYKLNAAGNAANVVTVTWSVAASFRWATSVQFAGTPIAFDLQDTTGTATATTVSSDSFITTAAGLILAGRSAYSAQSSSGFNQGLAWIDPITDNPGLHGSVGYRITTARVGPFAVTETGNSSTQRALCIACFGNQTAPYAFVNSTHALNSASAATLALPALSLTTGNHIFVHIRWEVSATNVTSVTDTAGNTYTPLTKLVNATGPIVSQWFYKLNAAGNASNVVTVTWSVATSWRWASSMQFSSVAAATFDLEQATGTSAASTTVTSGSFSTSAAGLILAGRSVYNGQTSSRFNQGIDWVDPVTDNTTNYGSVGYRITLGTLSAITVTETGNSNTNRALCIACFK
jgi:hypothetical protein